MSGKLRCVTGVVCREFLLKGACPIGLIIPGAGPAISGKVGGIVFSHNRGGQYARTHVIPTNPNTTRQASVRATFGALANTWSTTLSAAQRQAWTDFSNNVTVPNRIGQQVHLSGIAMFSKANSVRVQAALPIVPDGPLINSLANFTAPIPNVPLATGDAFVAFTVDAGDEWQDVGGFISLYAAKTQNEAINFFRGPFQFQSTFLGGTATLTGISLNLASLVTGVSGQKIPYRILSSAPDGRPSQVFNGVLAIA